MIGIAMLAVFALFAVLMYARVLPALLAVPAMALVIAALAGAGPDGLSSVLIDGSVRLAPFIVVVIFGALLSRVTMSTGIAETIVSYAAEFAGDQPVVLALALTAVTALLFTSLSGLGAIIMVGSIVLPIMMTVGIPRRTAATLFMLAFALGFIFNITQWQFYTSTFGIERRQMQSYAFLLAGIDCAALLAFIIVRFRATRGCAAWALPAEEPLTRKRVPLLALPTPLLPIVLYFALGMQPVIAFTLAACYGIALTKPREAVQTFVAAAIRGVEDVAPAILLFMGIGMLLTATQMPMVKLALAPVVTLIAPRSWLTYVMLFGIASPLSLYRGPLNPFGVGIGVYIALANVGMFSSVVLVAAIMAVVQVQNVCDPTNTQNVWVANFTGVRVNEITKLTLPFQVAVASLAVLCVGLFGKTLFGTPSFAWLQAASAATLQTSGLYAPDRAARTIGVRGASPGLSMSAADAVERTIAHAWIGYHALWVRDDPRLHDCAAKPYAAVLRLDASVYRWTYQPDQLDMGMELLDCAGWPVDQWHEQDALARGAQPTKDQLHQLASQLLSRFQAWQQEKPVLAEGLLTRGLAYDPTQGATYWYTLFKTADGQMRAYVRPGGPAYVAGMRTNDIVVKLDGKLWWEYGTFQTQSRAYDGIAHAFTLQRGNQSLEVTLGAAYHG
jgi:hypothetical protein